MAKSLLAAQPLPSIDILLVEDMPSDAFLVESLLGDGKAADYKTHCVKTQSEALALLNNHAFDVCLLDLTLPDTSGFSALINIQECVPDLPVVILTGINDTSMAKHAMRHGAQDYLLKDEIEITNLARAIDYAMERKQLEKNLFKRANCDALTGLANREQFLSRVDMALARAKRSDLGIAVLFIDLDRFKPINDLHGHNAGDEALKTVAQRIKSVLRSYDTPARFGGDEFAVLLENMESPRDTASIAQKILKTLTAPIHYQDQVLEISASIGIAFSQETVAPETLLQYADAAMYYAKKTGGGVFNFYTGSMHDEAAARLSLEEDLRTALEVGELRLHYQPYVNPDGEAVMGVEVLLRWAHPERGLLSAHEFLAAAESAKLMAEITRWTCAELRHDIAMWNAYGLPPLMIAINLSGSQLDAPDLLEWINSIAQENFMGAQRLAVEINEEAITQVTPARFLTLAKLHALGIGLHLDHFGLGTLPLTTLCSQPFSLLKIDMSLVKNMSSDISENTLISAAIMLAHHLGMKAGAVGVQSQWQAATLKEHACDTMQGYLMSEPMAAEQLAHWLLKPPLELRAS